MIRLLLVALSAVSALRVPLQAQPTQTRFHSTNRRELLAQAVGAAAALTTAVTPAFAKPTELAASGMSKEERVRLALARKAAEEEAALPINRLKQARERLSSASSLIDQGDWSELRDLIQETTGPSLSKLQAENKWTRKEIRIATVDMRKALFTIDKFAYSQQSFPGSDVFAGYCAPGVVPRSDDGCKMKPAVDKTPLLDALKSALTSFDQVIKLSDA